MKNVSASFSTSLPALLPVVRFLISICYWTSHQKQFILSHSTFLVYIFSRMEFMNVSKCAVITSHCCCWIFLKGNVSNSIFIAIKFSFDFPSSSFVTTFEKWDWWYLLTLWDVNDCAEISNVILGRFCFDIVIINHNWKIIWMSRGYEVQFRSTFS